MIPPTRRRLRPRIERQPDLDRLYSFLTPTSPEPSESDSHATNRADEASNIQNPTSEAVSAELTPQTLSIREALKPTMGRSSSSSDAGTVASSSVEAESLAAYVTCISHTVTIAHQQNHRLLTADFISINVGPKRKTYCVHSSLLFNRCPWFKQSEIWTSEGPLSKSLYLKDVLAEPFELFVEWLYRGMIRSLGAGGRILPGLWSWETLHPRQSVGDDGDTEPSYGLPPHLVSRAQWED